MNDTRDIVVRAREATTSSYSLQERELLISLADEVERLRAILRDIEHYMQPILKLLDNAP
jgi:hypothetical protein